jgi:hypothetical protein
MGVIRHEWKTPKKARFFGLLERGLSIPAAAKELSLDRGGVWIVSNLPSILAAIL